MTEEILNSILDELKTQRQSGESRQQVLTQISTALLGIPNTENKGLVGDFKAHTVSDELRFDAHSSRISRLERGAVALLGLGGTTGGTAAYWTSIKAMLGFH